MPTRGSGFSALERVLADAVADGLVPGGVVLCAAGEDVRFHRAFGARQIEPDILPASPDTVYDVASLTKALVTSVLVMQAVARGDVELDAPVARYLPEFQGPGKAKVTVRHLLCHASGLPAHRPFFESISAGPGARAAILLAAASEPLNAVSGAASVYSDLGFMLLGWLLERVAGAPLDVQAGVTLFAPLGLRSATFVDVTDGGDARLRLLARSAVAPTERCPSRGRMILGEVHDLNAFAMGGIAGHAGLFSDAWDVFRMASALCAAWERGGEGTIVARAVIREFWTAAAIPNSTWRLGWDGPAAHDSQAGSLISRRAVGHLGFTGCSLWIDPDRAWSVVVLTNRVHPTARPDPRFRAFRAAVQDAAIAAMTSG